MRELEIIEDALDGPPCRECGAMTRVVGIERHPIISQLTVVTIECLECGLIGATIAMPRASKARYLSCPVTPKSAARTPSVVWKWRKLHARKSAGKD